MNNHFKLALFGSAVFSLVFALALRNEPPKAEPSIQIVAKDDQPFDDTWRNAAVSVALKSANLADTAPKPIKTEIIALPTVIATPEELTPRLKRKPVVHKEHKDVCQRHNMRKVYRGRGWRCRK